MKKLIILALTLAGLSLAAAFTFAESDSDKAKVGFTLEKYFSLDVKKGTNVQFGRIDPLQKSYSKKNGSVLAVESNTNWAITTGKKVLRKPNDANAGKVLGALGIKLETPKGKGDDGDIKVDYSLSNLADLPAGDYVVEVVFTGSTR